MAYLLVLAAVLGIFGTSASHASPELNKKECEIFLTAGRASLTVALQLFARGLDDDRHTAGYVGVSRQTMELLLKTGRSEPGLSVPVHLTDEHREGSRIIYSQYVVSDLDWSRKAAIAIAIGEATKLSTLQMVKTRAIQPGRELGPDADKFLAAVVDQLSHLYLRQRSKETYSVTFPELAHAVYKAKTIPNDVPTMSGSHFSRRMQRLLKISDDYQFLITYQKLLRLSAELGFPGKELKARELVSLFAGLPSSAGYVLGIKPTLISAAKTREPTVPGLTLTYVSGIEPLGSEEFQFLSRLQEVIYSELSNKKRAGYE